MILFFGLSGLDLLNCLDQVSESQKSQIIDWIYLQQLEPEEKDFEKSIQSMLTFLFGSYLQILNIILNWFRWEIWL